MRHLPIVLLLVAVAGASLAGEPNRRPRRGYPPELPGAKVEVYKTIGDVKLNIYMFAPDGHQPTDKRAAVVFFFGGGWRGGSPTQFLHQSEYLASRGMVAMTADYRVSSRHGTKAVPILEESPRFGHFVPAHGQIIQLFPIDLVVAVDAIVKGPVQG
ncbi:MAG: carboxylesterase family protein, partial [Planctomycetes bacterium]|nr:carboxylesterase family protein [Planctomycetota bacterium]